MKYVPNAVSKRVGRQLLHLQKASPQIMFASGVVGVGVTVVLACRSTLRLQSVVGKSEEIVDNIKETRKNQPTVYSEQDAAHDLAVNKVKTAMAIVKLYGPAVATGVLSVAMLTGSHVVMTRRNVALTAAYASIEQTFNQYRERVKEQHGDEADRNFRYGVETVKEESGGKIVEHQRVADRRESLYARFFDKLCDPWDPNPEYNAMFLKCQQEYATNKLRAQGHLFLNEVYDALGIPRSKAGAVVGWVLGEGDDYVDFGIFDDVTNPRVRDFVNGREHSILLDFNVAGVIYDKI